LKISLAGQVVTASEAVRHLRYRVASQTDCLVRAHARQTGRRLGLGRRSAPGGNASFPIPSAYDAVGSIAVIDSRSSDEGI